MEGLIMATRQAAIISNDHRLRAKKPHVLRFYQHFSRAGDDKILEDQTFWTEIVFASREMFDKAMVKPDKLIEDCRQELIANAADMHHRGYEVQDLVVSFDGVNGFEVEALDARHVRMALRKHDSPVVDRKATKVEQHLKKAWKVSQDAQFRHALEVSFEACMQNLRPRTEHLKNLLWLDESKIVEQFLRVAHIWTQHEKGYGRIEEFFEALLKDGKFGAHRQCLGIWGEQIHAKPERFSQSYNINELTLSPGAIIPNPQVTAADKPSLLNTYLALDPCACLAEGSNLLSDAWRASLQDESLRSAAVVALMSGCTRFQATISRLSHGPNAQNVDPDPMKSAKVFFDRVSASAGVDFSTLLNEIPEFGEEPADPVRRYYANEISLSGSYGRLGLTIPRAISTIMPIGYCEETLSLALKARLLATPSHIAYATTKYPRDQDEAYFGKVITNPHTSLAQVVGVVDPKYMHKSNFKQLENVPFGQAFVAQIPDKTRHELIAKGYIPLSLLTHESDIAMVLEVDMGL
ncbi:hypothetical protein RBE51_20065 [Pseudomonas taiwanensis]|uniref:hypothetical protein n=1 Tax=Pseudomonas taiwanensis TaxID=470150 RepID=UPI0028DEEAD6|nr:hypothetical protein [Pseudomonas taiwanensis]MDT8925089.1 hypothetical protein [Pseudomonas taiwanensis]